MESLMPEYNGMGKCSPSSSSWNICLSVKQRKNWPVLLRLVKFCVTWCTWRNNEKIPWSISSSFSIIYNHNISSCNALFLSNIWHFIASIQSDFWDIHREIQELNYLSMVLTIYNICQPYQQLSSIQVYWG